MKTKRIRAEISSVQATHRLDGALHLNLSLVLSEQALVEAGHRAADVLSALRSGDQHAVAQALHILFSKTVAEGAARALPIIPANRRRMDLG